MLADARGEKGRSLALLLDGDEAVLPAGHILVEEVPERAIGPGEREKQGNGQQKTDALPLGDEPVLASPLDQRSRIERLADRIPAHRADGVQFLH